MSDPKTMIPVPVLLGPTAAGKTALASTIAAERSWEIVSCDSRQIYRGMNIGTAKPDQALLKRVRHHLIDIIEPDTPYSAFDFAQDARKVLRVTAEQGGTTLVCGGTGLYFERLRRGISPMVASDPELRARLQERVQREGSTSLHDELRRCDPSSASTIHPHDAQRIIRALIVYHTTGTPMSALRNRAVAPAEFSFRIAVVLPPRDLLYERINRRVEEMVSRGLYEEFVGLCQRGYDERTPGLQCIGYRELFSVRNGTRSMAAAVEEIKKNTRNYAKRQYAWFRAHNREDIVPWDDNLCSLRLRIIERIVARG